MQEVCSSLDSPLGPQIKSESPINSLQQQALQAKLVTNCDKRSMDTYWMTSGGGNGATNAPNNGGVIGGGPVGTTESGFINSQPSMAEFLTHLNPDSPKMMGNQGGYGVVGGDQMDGVPEYPWMKEKKTARKNNSQGK